MKFQAPSSLRSKLIDYTLTFSNLENPGVHILSQEGEKLGAVRVRKHRDGSISFMTYHYSEGYSNDLDASHSLEDAKLNLVNFHINNYEN